jgi:hypothetical protein
MEWQSRPLKATYAVDGMAFKIKKEGKNAPPGGFESGAAESSNDSR